MSNAKENGAAQVAGQLMSALNDNALDEITGGYNHATARATAEEMFATGKIVADKISKEEAINRATFLEGVKFGSDTNPTA